MADKIIPGKETTEYAVTKSASTWAIVIMILGVLTTTGATIASALGTESTVGIIVGAVIAVAGTLMKTFTALGYDKSRTDIKVAVDSK